jgi:hypothetical protein
MRHFMGNGFFGLRDTFLRNRQDKARRRDRDADVLNTLESVVDGTDSKIRLVPGYKKQLRNVILPALEFTDDLVSKIPKAIEVSHRTFTTDPYVNAFFTNVRDLQSIISHSSEVKDYLSETGDSARCYALLCMKRTEKTVTGMELSGDMLRKDVLQVAVSFSDHRIYAPARSEAEARDGLRNCLFQGLVTNALERIMQLRLASHHRQIRHQMLHSRLRPYRQNTGEAKPGTREGDKIARSIEATGRELDSLEKEIMDTPLLTPRLILQQVVDVFSEPEGFVRINKLPLRLNKMGIKISDNVPQPCNQLDLTEVTIGKDSPRVVTMATFPKQELLPVTGAFSTRLAYA